MPKFESIFDKLNPANIVVSGLIWILIFSVLYIIFPFFDSNSHLNNSVGEPVTSFLDCVYFSIITATTLGYGDIQPQGLLKIMSSIEVLGGIVLAGLAVNSIVSIPSRRARKAMRVCTGWWIEKTTISNKTFYSFTWMIYDGDKLVKNGVNFDPGGEMDGTRYLGNVITSSFPMLLSIYKNDNRSGKYYTDGIFKIEMQLDLNGTYSQYEGFCYDTLGMRDRIVGHRLDNNMSINDLQKMSVDEKWKIINDHFL